MKIVRLKLSDTNFNLGFSDCRLYRTVPSSVFFSTHHATFISNAHPAFSAAQSIEWT